MTTTPAVGQVWATERGECLVVAVNRKHGFVLLAGAGKIPFSQWPPEGAKLIAELYVNRLMCTE